MNKFLISAALSLASLFAWGQATATFEVVPRPAKINSNASRQGVSLGCNAIINAPDSLKREAQFLKEYLSKLPKQSVPTKIQLSGGLANTNPEAYDITVDANGIRIQGASAAGVFYGIQTLRKAIATAPKGEIVTLPLGKVEDAPRFAYRGAHFDVSRHFFNSEDVKKFIDMMALHNLNTLHWHLNDDQGWRIEIKKYPGLVDIGSHRDSTIIGHNEGPYDRVPVGGFFTQDQARDIVEYAAQRHINVIPEIDLPGHMLGALAAYPELGCTGGPYGVWGMWGVSDDVLCAGNDDAITLVKDVLNEIIDVFPSPIIHIGGDECPKVNWEKCPKCQARIKREGIKGDDRFTAEQQLQAWVTRQAAQTVTDRGRVAMGWDEILEGDIPQSTIIHSWRGHDGAVEGTKRGHRVVSSPVDYMYFDYYQSKDRNNEPPAIGGFLPLEKVYSFNPTEGLTEQQAALVMGPQANLWTEYITTYPQVEYQELPRMAALSEVAWSAPEQKNWDDFQKRLSSLINVYKAQHYNYRPVGKP